MWYVWGSRFPLSHRRSKHAINVCSSDAFGNTAQPGWNCWLWCVCDCTCWLSSLLCRGTCMFNTYNVVTWWVHTTALSWKSMFQPTEFAAAFPTYQLRTKKPVSCGGITAELICLDSHSHYGIETSKPMFIRVESVFFAGEKLYFLWKQVLFWPECIEQARVKGPAGQHQCIQTSVATR